MLDILDASGYLGSLQLDGRVLAFRVRDSLAERSAGRGYEHRLRDFNNDPRTSPADLHALLDEALARTTGERP